MTDLDYYELLDVVPTASTAEIKDAYRRAVRTAHPDVGGTSGMFRLITAAYETLSDPGKRADYDARLGRDGATRRQADDLDDDFEDDDDLADERPRPGGWAGAGPAWGEEETWDAAEGRKDAISRWFNLDSWVHGTRGFVLQFGLAVTLAWFFAAGVGLLVYAPDVLRPDAAGGDLLGWYADQPGLRLTVVVVYALMLRTVESVGMFLVPIAHAFFVLCLVAWPIAYWDVASSAERALFLIGVVLWLAYNVVIVWFVALTDAREGPRLFDGSRDRLPLSTLTRWARTDAGKLALHIGQAVTGALFAAVAYVMIFGIDLIRPAAARSDALEAISGHQVWIAVVIAAFGALAYIFMQTNPVGVMELLFMIFAVGLLSWPLVYWDIATPGERWTFGALAALWALFVAAYFSTASLVDRRKDEREWSW